ncbi:unnamed protein product [Thelazia callipaeda]|uniref:Uncharacterized protein n=1 Tax=Thelazia callipaeda TaxID=103827 RepID=A0A0N5CMJ7_THECL|nr:unnamed protein product [Thelazia callipaeda]
MVDSVENHAIPLDSSSLSYFPVSLPSKASDNIKFAFSNEVDNGYAEIMLRRRESKQKKSLRSDAATVVENISDNDEDVLFVYIYLSCSKELESESD